MTELRTITVELFDAIKEIKDPKIQALISESYDESRFVTIARKDRYKSLKETCTEILVSSFPHVENLDALLDSVADVISDNMYEMNSPLSEMTLDPDFSGTYRVDCDLDNNDVYKCIRSFADEQLRDELHQDITEKYNEWLEEQE